MTPRTDIALIYGSARDGRFCDTVAAWTMAAIERAGGFAVDVIDPVAVDVARGVEGRDTAARSALRARLDRADGFVVVTPEYNHSFPAPLKALIDSAHAEWQAKPVAFVSYGGGSGGIRAVEHLRHVFAELHAVGLRDGVGFVNAWNQFDEQGALRDPDGAESAAATMLARLSWWARALRAGAGGHRLRGGGGVTVVDHPSPRVLVVGRSPTALEAIGRELSALGLAVSASARPETAAVEFEARSLDLVAIDAGVDDATRAAVRLSFIGAHPGIRLLDVRASVAVPAILAAANGAEAGPRVDLAAYARRIGHDAALRADMATLRAIHTRHPDAIAFEAIDVLLGRGIELSPEAVDAKLIGRRRGGYCFEQNGLFRRVLEEIGFDATGLAARVRWNVPPGTPPAARTHMVLRVILDGAPWLVDVGFGTCALTEPIRMDTDAAQSTGHDTYRVIEFGDDLLLQVRRDEAWLPVYEITREPQLDSDYQAANWFTATHPASHFRHNLMVARTTRESRYTLLDGRFTERWPDGRAERKLLDADGIHMALEETFGLAVEPDWRPAIERAADASSG